MQTIRETAFRENKFCFYERRVFFFKESLVQPGNQHERKTNTRIAWSFVICMDRSVRRLYENEQWAEGIFKFVPRKPVTFNP